LTVRRDDTTVNVTTALRAGGRLLTERSASVLPVYLLATGLYGVARVPLVLAGMAAFALVAADGRLGALLRELDGLDSDSVDPQSVSPGLVDAMQSLVSADVLLLVAAGVLASTLLAVVVAGAARAATLHAVFGLLRDDDGVRAALVGARSDWLTLLGVRLLLLVALAAVTVPVGLLGLGLATVSAAAGVVALLLGGLLAILFVLVVVALFAFAEQAVVVDGVGVIAAVRRSAGFPFRRPEAFVGYVAVAFGALLVTVTVAGIASLGGATRVTALVGTVLVRPVLDGFKTALYAERDLSSAATPALLDRGRAAFGGGLRSLGAFVRDHPLANLGSAVVFGGGVAGGWAATARYDTSLPIREGVGEVFGAFPVGTFVNLAANNWLVAADTAYSGIAVGVPAVVNLGFNGVLVGALGGVFDPVAFAALVAPHGVVEVPALVFGGGLGLWLGGVGYRAARGRTTADGVAAAVRRAYRVLLGLVPLFVVAAFVEAFLTPAVASFVLGG
jgi:uncharacterized membrane protein SpoIIM required for sporulation